MLLLIIIPLEFLGNEIDETQELNYSDNEYYS
jgi:hypothetical protein